MSDYKSAWNSSLKMNKKIFQIVFLIFLFINSCTKTKQIQTVSPEDVSALNPEQVVILYFQAWNDEQYDVMYSLISDGFKQLEPTAKTFEKFKANMEKFYETSLGVRIVEAKEAYQSENEVGVNYKIEIISKDSTKKEFSSAYTLKKRANGWKLIHPYGENIDKS